mmetsp:Transcript_35991/g.95334  ORF Transcript_35991/g.95334 Transcript_35991/m.95334 type:complete len:295 (-) Transcript_35991:1200-2084(-)
MRWTRWMACSSTAGFHQRSSMYRREAATRLSPTPPALRETSSTRPALLPSGTSSESHSTQACRWSRLSLPLNCFEGMPDASRALPTRSRNEVHCEKTTARRPASMSLRSRRSSSFILVLRATSAPPASAKVSTPPELAAEVFARRREGRREAPGSTFSALRFRAPGLRHTGHSPFQSLKAWAAQSRQKMCPHGVMAASSGGSQQIGQSGRVPFRRSSRRFPTKDSDMPSLPSISLRQRCSRLVMSSSFAPSRAKTRNGWHNACRSFRSSCRMWVYLEATSPCATNVSNVVCAFL